MHELVYCLIKSTLGSFFFFFFFNPGLLVWRFSSSQYNTVLVLWATCIFHHPTILDAPWGQVLKLLEVR